MLSCVAALAAGSVAAQERLAIAETDASENAAPRSVSLSSDTPEGFENLLEPTPVVVDVYFRGQLIGTTSGVQEPGYFTFDEPELVIALIADIQDPDTVIAALRGRLNSNPELVCGRSPREGCGQLSPEVAGIIVDPLTFRLDLFVAPGLVKDLVLDDPVYLPMPKAGLSFLSNFTGSLSGAEENDVQYVFQNRSILAWRNARLTGQFAQSRGFGFETQILSAEVDANALRYRGGLFWSSPLAFTGQARVYGAGIGSQFDTRAGGDAAFSLPLFVFLQRGAQINVRRDGRLLSTSIYQPGNQVIDTSDFPSGAYNVELEIIEQGGETRTETRFFTRDRALPPPGKFAFSITGGALAQDIGNALPDIDDNLFLQGTMAYRVADRVSLEGGALSIGPDFVFEGGASFLDDGYNARVVGLVGNDGNYGVIGEVSWFDLRNFSVNAFARRTWGPGINLSPPNNQGIAPINNVNLLVGNSSQYGGNLGWRLGNANIRFSGFYFDREDAEAFYAVGPSVDYAMRVGQYAQMTLFADGQRTSQGWEARIGLRVNFNRPNFSVFAEGGGAYRQLNSVEETGVIGNVLATYSTVDNAVGDVSVAAGYARDLDTDRARGEVTLDSQYGRFLGQVEHAFGASDVSGTRYSANFSTSVAAGGGSFSIGGREIGESGVIVSLSGGDLDYEANVLVDDSIRARVRPGQAVTIFLRPYGTYAVRLVPSAGATGRLDTVAREVSLFPGNLEALRWSVTRSQSVYGRLVDASGQPVEDAIILGGRDFIQTDENGYFQGELSEGDELTVRRNGEQVCELAPISLEANGLLLRLGDVVCRMEDTE